MLLDIPINGVVTVLPRQVGIECNFYNGQNGTCMETTACSSQGGSYEAGHCPGRINIQCCALPVDSPTTSISSNTKITAPSTPSGSPAIVGATTAFTSNTPTSIGTFTVSSISSPAAASPTINSSASSPTIVGALVGAVVGAIISLVILIIALVLWIRRRKRAVAATELTTTPTEERVTETTEVAWVYERAQLHGDSISDWKVHELELEAGSPPQPPIPPQELDSPVYLPVSPQSEDGRR